MKKFLFILAVSIFTIITSCSINISAAEADDFTLSYCRQGKWSNFSGKTVFSDYIDCIKIQTSSKKDYYLSYKTWNEGKNGYYSAVKSNITDSQEYAGSSGKRIRNLSISVYNKNGDKLDEGIVVMYRAYIGGVWLPWVSNASADWMSYVQRKYKLDGVLDTSAGNAGINTDYIEGLEIRVFEENSIDDLSGANEKSALIDAPLISQIGAYPTGCESVSAVMALQHSGFDISVDDFIDLYLKTGNSGNFDPNLCFGGNPRSSSGMGCYAPVIQAAANEFLDTTYKKAEIIKNHSLTELCEKYIDNGIPVVVWATVDMQKALTGKKLEYDNRIIQWISPEHCLLLVGYDENSYIFNDPQKPDAVTYYNKNKAENAYCALGCQAIAIVDKPLPDECFSLSETEYTYNGAVRTPTVTVKDFDGNTLVEDTDYTLTYDSGRKNAGTYKVTVNMMGNFKGTKTLTFKIKPIAISSKFSFKLSATSYTYNGTVRTPSVTVKNHNGTSLAKNTHYTLTYATGRKNVGTYKVTVKMKGNYSGTKTLTFKINPIKISSKFKFKLSATSCTYSGKVKTPTVTVKNHNGTTLTKNTHYTVTYATGRKNVGTYKVTIKMKGNYSGTKVLTFKINPVKTTVSKLTAGKKSLKVYITKKSTQVTGYQIQYSTSKTFKSAKTKTVSSYKTTSTTLSGLSAKKTYYVRVRTYKTVGGVKYYSGWSTYKYKKTQ